MKDQSLLPLLFAEDSADDRRLLERALNEAGITNPVEFCEDGSLLLKALERRHSEQALPGLIVMDLNMPRLDGLETLKQLRLDPRFKALPVLILSTSGSPREVLDCYSSGASSVLIKPLRFTDFVELLKLIKQYWIGLVMLPQS